METRVRLRRGAAGSTGYVVLWGNALEGLSEAPQYTVFGRGDQADFDTVATAVTWAGPGEHFTKRATEVTAQDLPELADVLPGHRNIALFHHIRYYAYRQVAHHAEFMTFADEVANFATGCRNQLPDVAGFPESEAAGIAKSVATWTWAVFTRGIEGAEKRREPHDSARPPDRPWATPATAGTRP